MNIREIQAKSILRKHKKIDSWFVSRYGMNFYRGCLHNCVYCDGRAEKYNVEGEFGEDVAVKINAIEILKRELDPARKRKPMKKSFFMLGGGVGDSYQYVEKKYQLTRKALELFCAFKHPVQILTKSTLVKRDVDILKKINEQSKVIVNFSFSSVDERISKIFEPGVPLPGERLETITYLKNEGLTCGMFLMPVIPFITDKPDLMEKSIVSAKEAGADFIIFSGMTLKQGRQQNYFYEVIKKYYPELLSEYQHIYLPGEWGNAIPEYYQAIHEAFYSLAKRYKIPIRIPADFYRDYLNENDLVVVILDQMDYLLKMMGRKSPYGYSAYSISQLNQPISSMRTDLKKLKGVGETTERIIIEILDTKRSAYYEKLLWYL